MSNIPKKWVFAYLTLINNILNISRIESKSFTLHMSRINLNDFINNIKKDIEDSPSLTKDKNIRIIFSPNTNTKKSPIIYADEDKISQVINNLILNSINFIEKDGDIIITTEEMQQKNEDDNKSNKKYVLVKIKDNGKGIDKEIYNKIFEKFVTKSDSGTGLGLYISKKIIEMHGGTIKGYNNSSERGATFEFTLPLEYNK